MTAARTTLRPRADRRRGALTLEYAVVLMLLLLLTIGTVDLGLGVRSYNTLGNLASEATRYASVHSSTSSDPATNAKIKAFVNARANGLKTDALSVTATWLPSNERGSMVRVQLAYVYEPLTPIVPEGTIRLQTAAKMIISE